MLRNRSKAIYNPSSKSDSYTMVTNGGLPSHNGRRKGRRRQPFSMKQTVSLVGILLLLAIVGFHSRSNNKISKIDSLAKIVTPTRHPVNGVYDIAVLGCGPAGLTAGLYGARAGLSVLVLGSETGLLSETPRLDNFPSFVSGQGGQGWIQLTKQQAASFGASFAPPGLLVSSLNRHKPKKEDENPHFVLHVPGQNAIKSWSVIIATGAKPRHLNLPKEDVLWGKSLHSCAICDGSLYADKEVVVVGGGDAAVDAAILLARHAKLVTLVHRRNEYKASNQVSIDLMKKTQNIQILTPFVVERWETDVNNELIGVSLQRNGGKQEEKTISCHGAFVMIGATPNTEWAKDKVDLDDEGLVRLKGETATSLPGVFAAGEVSDTVYRQAITAAASGAQAAIDAERWLRETRGVRQVVAQAETVEKDSAINLSRVEKSVSSVPAECDLVLVECIEDIVHKYPVVVFSKPYCPYCKRALEALSIEGVTKPYIIDLQSIGSKGQAIQDTLKKMTGRRTVPNVFIGGTSIGGGTETTGLQREGKLQPLLQKAGALSI